MDEPVFAQCMLSKYFSIDTKNVITKLLSSNVS
jgi:hypothetical protein